KRFYGRAAKIIDAPWAIAVGADFLHPQTTGPKARGTDLANRYVINLARSAHVSLPVAKAFNLVLNLVEPTSALMRPRTVLRVLRTYRRSPALTGGEGGRVGEVESSRSETFAADGGQHCADHQLGRLGVVEPAVCAEGLP